MTRSTKTFADEIAQERAKALARRHFLKGCGLGLGAMALDSMLGTSMQVEAQTVKKPHFAPKAKRVIYLFQAGAPSQLDLFDYKPSLEKYNGKPVPQSLVKDINYAFIKQDAGLYASELKFARHGGSGAWISEAMPHLAGVADSIAIVRSMVADAINHAPGQIFMNTGSVQFGRPSMGAWVIYGLGCETEELPAFVVLSSAGGTSGGAGNWGSGFLPTIYQGVPFRRAGDPILALSNPRGISREMQRQTLDSLKRLNQHHLDATGDPEISTRISSFEMAFKMQKSAPELVDISKESKATLEMYGAQPGQASYANNCLLARRLIERGVRFVQLFHEAWDHHSEVAKGVRNESKRTDQATAALIKDLAARGLLEDTLVIWGGEFGRTPMVESNADAGRSLGRDHHNKAFTMWLAGGGIKRGVTLGETDELGFNVVEDRVHVHDLHATLLHLLGIDHERLTFRFQGRDFRLTDVHGSVVKKLLA